MSAVRTSWPLKVHSRQGFLNIAFSSFLEIVEKLLPFEVKAGGASFKGPVSEKIDFPGLFFLIASQHDVRNVKSAITDL